MGLHCLVYRLWNGGDQTGSPADEMHCSVSAAGGWVVSLVAAAGMDGVRLGFWSNTVINIRAHEKSTITYLFIEYPYRLRIIYSLCLNMYLFILS